MGQGHTVSLSARDIALVILSHDELERTEERTATVSTVLLRTRHATLDTIYPRDSQMAERRLNESLHCLYEANCLARIDLPRLHRDAHAEYHLIPIGEAIAEWHITESEFSREPLTAIFRIFQVQVSHLFRKGEPSVPRLNIRRATCSRNGPASWSTCGLQERC